jgi:hypothetical protein
MPRDLAVQLAEREALKYEHVGGHPLLEHLSVGR